jgi:hypothetical protein
MTSRVSSARSVAALTFLLIASCATTAVPLETRATVEPLDLYPLRVGHAWSYDVDTAEPTTTLAITRVEAFDGRIAIVRNAHSLVRYEVSPDGIRLAASNAWLLRAPLEEGATWPAPGGRTAELVSRTAAVQTPAGEFEGCFEVLETGGKLELEVRTVYCPDVGPVLVASTMRSGTSDRTLTVSARLRGYDVTTPPASDR